MLDETMKRNSETEQNELRLWLCRQLRYKAICIREFYSDDVQKRRKKCFSSTSCFFFNYFYSLLLCLFLLPKLLQGLLITWLQVKKHIGVHSPYVNLKTHVQGKQVYVGLHHLVQILYCNQTLCVCVCVCVLPRSKAGSKTRFGVAHSFLLLKLQNLELHSL
jgi:hypothetical protein